MSLIKTTVHELGHALVAINIGFDQIGFTRSASGQFACWTRDSFMFDAHRAAYGLGGPLADLILKGILRNGMNYAAIEDAVAVYLAADDDGSTDCDAARFRRFYKPLSAKERGTAMYLALGAANDAVQTLERYPRAIAVLAKAIDRLKPDEVLVLTADAARDLRGGHFPIKLIKTYLGNWLNAGDTAGVEDEMRDEAFAIIHEMMERGEIVNGELTEAGLARLDLNEL